mmetsp:Transcript_52956/g.113529  ORF Transcript_52956/g.113529 Transcript_52956/m.113529 type:complete len:224 (+) Transcript_52956:194-865(+)
MTAGTMVSRQRSAGYAVTLRRQSPLSTLVNVVAPWPASMLPASRPGLHATAEPHGMSSHTARSAVHPMVAANDAQEHGRWRGIWARNSCSTSPPWWSSSCALPSSVCSWYSTAAPLLRLRIRRSTMKPQPLLAGLSAFEDPGTCKVGVRRLSSPFWPFWLWRYFCSTSLRCWRSRCHPGGGLRLDVWLASFSARTCGVSHGMQPNCWPQPCCLVPSARGVHCP